jgi:hypothetical protein
LGAFGFFKAVFLENLAGPQNRGKCMSTQWAWFNDGVAGIVGVARPDDSSNQAAI